MACTSSGGGGVESKVSSGGGGGVAMTIPMTCSPCRLPRRLRRRLSETSKGPVTVEEIQAKLNEADHRRQQFYDFVSSKARPKQRSPLRSSNHEAKFNAGEENRLTIISKAQMRLARYWRRFVTLKGTTCSLAKAFEGLDITQKTVGSMPFEQLAFMIESNAALKAVKSFLDRLEVHLRVRRGTSCSSGLENIDHLLKRVATPKRRRNLNHSNRVRGQKRRISGEERAQSRYPVRIVLCAYMVLGHPDAVLSGKGGHETALAKAALLFIKELELLTKRILEGHYVKSPLGDNHVTFRSQLEMFDKAWCSYLYCFVLWKVKDAKLLEEDLVRAACQLELSMMHTCKVTPDSGNIHLTHDMKAIQKQVIEDQTLLKEKVQNLSGVAGVERMENAISDVRTKFLSKDSGSTFVTPVAHIKIASYSDSSHCSPSLISDEASDIAGGSKHSSSVVRSLFNEDDRSAGPSEPIPDADVHLSNDLTFSAENELIVNEILHEHHRGVADKLDIGDKDENAIKKTIKETMEQAFWDGVMVSMNQEQPDFSWVLKLMTEIRDDLCELSPDSWRQEITDAIDLDILTEVLKNESVDMDYLGKLLEYALINLQKLSAPASDDEMKAARQNLLNELREISQVGDCSNSSIAIAMIKGLRFVLHQIKILKREISKARIRMAVMGPAGLEYLQKVFLDRYGAPSNAPMSLLLTKSWLSLVRTNVDKVWGEYVDSLSALPGSQVSYLQGIPSNNLQTGCSTTTSRMRSLEPIVKGKEQPECRGVGVDLFVRVGLLKLVSNIEGLEQEALPETLKLNLLRLRGVQSLLQKIIVICTSMLILRQILLTERLVASPSDMDNIISQSYKQLSELLDKDQDVGIKEIVEAMVGLSDDVNHVVNLKKLQAMKGVVSNMLSTSLNSGDAVFTRVFQVVQLAVRATVLGGTGNRGRQLAEMSLRRVGAAFLTGKVIEAAEVLIVLATVTESVHGSWYEQVLKNI